MISPASGRSGARAPSSVIVAVDTKLTTLLLPILASRGAREVGVGHARLTAEDVEPGGDVRVVQRRAVDGQRRRATVAGGRAAPGWSPAVGAVAPAAGAAPVVASPSVRLGQPDVARAWSARSCSACGTTRRRWPWPSSARSPAASIAAMVRGTSGVLGLLRLQPNGLGLGGGELVRGLVLVLQLHEVDAADGHHDQRPGRRPRPAWVRRRRAGLTRSPAAAGSPGPGAGRPCWRVETLGLGLLGQAHRSAPNARPTGTATRGWTKSICSSDRPVRPI